MTEYTDNMPQIIEGRNLSECQKRLYDMYKTNYTIISTAQKFKPGKFLGLGRKEEYLEVTYKPIQRDSDMSSTKKSEEDFERAKIEILKSVAESNMSKQSYSLKELQSEIASMRDDIAKQFKNLNDSQTGKHETIKRIEDLLSENEFTFDYISQISERMKSEFSLEQLEDFKVAQRKVVDWIGNSIEISSDRAFRPPHVIVLVGPTGVGKTTTIAKLAAKQVLDAQKADKLTPRLCIVTTDSMRVGAEEQLAKYSEILGYKVKKAERAEDVQKIYDDVKEDVDTIYIDTAGYSPNDSFNIGKMKALLDIPGVSLDIYLVVSASTKSSDLARIMQNYEPFAYRAVIVTKWDESDRYGNVISTLHEKHKSVAYICDGQNAARNLECASVIKFLMNLQDFEIDRIHIEEEFGE